MGFLYIQNNNFVTTYDIEIGFLTRNLNFRLNASPEISILKCVLNAGSPAAKLTGSVKWSLVIDQNSLSLLHLLIPDI